MLAFAMWRFAVSAQFEMGRNHTLRGEARLNVIGINGRFAFPKMPLDYRDLGVGFRDANASKALKGLSVFCTLFDRQYLVKT